MVDQEVGAGREALPSQGFAPHAVSHAAQWWHYAARDWLWIWPALVLLLVLVLVLVLILEKMLMTSLCLRWKPPMTMFLNVTTNRLLLRKVSTQQV